MVAKHIPNIYQTYTLHVIIGLEVYVEVHDRYMIGTCLRIIYLRRISHLQRLWRRLRYMMDRKSAKGYKKKLHINTLSQYIISELQYAA